MIQNTMNDSLRDFIQTGSGDAFERIVRAHGDAVYSQCRRQLGDPAEAEEVTQQVFITLAEKARRIPANAILSGWLFNTARYCCANHRRGMARRREAERKAAVMRSRIEQDSAAAYTVGFELEPLLDDAIARLGRTDRDAVLLRFFEGRSTREVGTALGVSEDAAKQRISRAVEKLRSYFNRRGVSAESAMVVSALGHAVKPAGPNVATTVVKAAVARSAAASLTKSSGWPASWTKLAGAAVAAGAIAAIVAMQIRGASAQTPLPQEPPAPVVAPKTVAAAQLPQDSPVKALEKLCRGIEADDKAMIDQCLCDDGQDPAAAALGRGMVEGLGPAGRLEKDWMDKFNVTMEVPDLSFDDASTRVGMIRGMLAIGDQLQIKIDGDIAQVRIPLPPQAFSGVGIDRNYALGKWSGGMLVLRRVNGNWKLNTDRTFNFVITIYRLEGNNTDNVEVERQVQQGVNDALESVAVQIEAGDIKTAPQAAAAVRSRVLKGFKQAGVNGASIMVLPVIGG
jgi:RNA polymerase sigma factor (sigma-70 family)